MKSHMASRKTGAEIKAGIRVLKMKLVYHRIIEFWFKNANANIKNCIKKLIKK